MISKKKIGLLLFLFIILIGTRTMAADSKREYENRFRIMLQYAVNINEYVRRHLQDVGLCTYAQEMTTTNARAAEQMTPPQKYKDIHPHFLLVLENVERSFYYAVQRRFDRYRHHQKIVNKELSILETLSDRAGIEPYYDRY